MLRKSLLFLCAYQGGRSMVAHACAERAGADLTIRGACFEPGAVNPYAIEVLHEWGLAPPSSPIESLFELIGRNERFDMVVVLCEEGREFCELIRRHAGLICRNPDSLQTLSVPAFGTLEGSPESQRADARRIRDQINEGVIALLQRHSFDRAKRAVAPTTT